MDFARVAAWGIVCAASFVSWDSKALAQELVRGDGHVVADSATVWIVVDLDDDDENGVRDSEQDHAIPLEDLLSLRVEGADRWRLECSSGLRLVDSSGNAEGTTREVTSARDANVFVQALSTAGFAEQLRLFSGANVVRRIEIRPVRIHMLDARNAPIGAAGYLRVSREIANIDLARADAGWNVSSRGQEDLRVEIRTGASPFGVAGSQLRFVSRETNGDPSQTSTPRAQLLLRDWVRGESHAWRSSFVRLVIDAMDASANGVVGRALRVALRDEIRAELETPSGVVSQSWRVGGVGPSAGHDQVLHGRLRLRVLRIEPGGGPIFGLNEEQALRIARRQLAIANEIWLQCNVGFGDPEQADVAVVDPPPPALLAIGNEEGLFARGGGVIRFVANDVQIGPLSTVAGEAPVRTALRIAEVLEAKRFDVRVTLNPATEQGAAPSADIVVRDRQGNLAVLTPDGEAPLSTDAQQTLSIGRVDLRDGLLEFDNMNASSGTLEERTLVKTLADDDPSTVDIFFVNRFTEGGRQGEAFIRAGARSIVNTLILDRNGVQQERSAWTQSHELGHVLLNDPLHPDNVGTDRPWLLMDADASLAAVNGPKRLSENECLRARYESGPEAPIPILRPIER